MIAAGRSGVTTMPCASNSRKWRTHGKLIRPHPRCWFKVRISPILHFSEPGGTPLLIVRERLRLVLPPSSIGFPHETSLLDQSQEDNPDLARAYVPGEQRRHDSAGPMQQFERLV